MKLNVNGKEHDVAVPEDMPLLWVLRDVLGLTGTKFGCGMAQCGACTVHLDGEAVRSCVLPVVGRRRASSHDDRGPRSRRRSHPVQRAWTELDVVQCGYCQSGPDHGGRGAAQGASRSRRDARHRRGAQRQRLPLRHLPADPRGRPPRRRAHARAEP